MRNLDMYKRSGGKEGAGEKKLTMFYLSMQNIAHTVIISYLIRVGYVLTVHMKF